jgi:prepilin-type N-terminal cleavage/methylation domain-containing protein
MRETRSQKGFTLIELLIVIAIISIIGTIVLPTLNTARDKGRTAAAQGQLRQVLASISLLADDTGKWPNGCPVGVIADYESSLNGAQTGLATAPSVGIQDAGPPLCAWSASDIAKWSGPYIETPIDPWGNAYEIDPDYTPYYNGGAGGCASAAEAETPVLVSYGPDGTGRNLYNCDDVFIRLPL